MIRTTEKEEHYCWNFFESTEKVKKYIREALVWNTMTEEEAKREYERWNEARKKFFKIKAT